ncbi:hypothetical protein BGZ47_006324 [Haplosporangium gracile]|nr:hypothetical protein BGZ47_006324 [Haplosporangium gracile]
MSRSFGFPTLKCEKNCWAELNQKGIELGLDRIVLRVTTAYRRITHTGLAVATQAATAGVAIPEALTSAMAAEELTQKLSHQDQPLSFYSDSD